MTIIQSIHKSRFGYHSCDCATFLKLKKLNKFYYQAVYRLDEWERWNRKLPKNRVLRKWNRNEKGQKISFEIVGPNPEPQRYPVFLPYKVYFNIPGGLKLDHHEVIGNFAIARRPHLTLETVKPLKLTIDQIDKMLVELEAFKNA